MRGRLFRQLVENDKELLSIFGTVNAYSSVLAKKNGVKSIYLSGSGVAAASFGLPDLGFTKLEDVVEDARRITSACDLPLLVDVDTGFGSSKSIQNTIRSLEEENVAAIHIEDQVDLKRCGHRPNKKLVSITEMQDRIKAAVELAKSKDQASWIEVSFDEMKGTFLSYPDRSELSSEINENLIIELYSK